MKGRAADVELVAALRSGDETAFARLVDDLSPSLLRMARLYVSTDAAAQEVVQETWLGVIQGLGGFEGRAALRTWVFRILINVAKTRGVRESRSVPFSSAFGPGRFLPDDDERRPGYWAIGPTAWPEQAAETAESLRLIGATVRALPAAQAEVITLRDVVGCSAEETCNALGLSETNQRVLLHRARKAVRAALEEELDATEPTV